VGGLIILMATNLTNFLIKVGSLLILMAINLIN
jgi:hypothetical protein